MSRAHAIRIHETGGPHVLRWEEVDVPTPQAGEVIVRNEAVGLNFIDTYYRSGLYPAALPTGLGFEGAGVVEEVGEGVTHIGPGDSVAYAQGPLGAYATRRAMPAWQLVKLPSEISSETAAAVMLKGLTVQYLFRQTYPLKQGETILFHAAAGGVGLIACQWARALGVKLIGTVSSPEKAEVARAHGAWMTIDYTKEDVAKRVQEMTGGEKVAVVYDGVGKDTWSVSLDCLRPRGLMVSFGNASGPVTGVNLSILAQKGSLYVTRPTLGAYVGTPEALKTAATELFEYLVRGAIRADVRHRYALAEAQLAHTDLESRKITGSVVLMP